MKMPAMILAIGVFGATACGGGGGGDGDGSVPASAPVVVTTGVADNITASNARLAFSVEIVEDVELVECGVCFSEAGETPTFVEELEGTAHRCMRKVTVSPGDDHPCVNGTARAYYLSDGYQQPPTIEADHTYRYRGYAIDKDGKTYYGADLLFKTIP